MTTKEAAWQRVIELGFELLYHDLAWTYDAVSWIVSLGVWRDWQRTALKHVEGHDVLEIGHGTGYILVALAWAGYTVTGVDRSAQMGHIARKRLREAGLGNIKLVQTWAQTLPFQDRSYDTVVATFPTEYIMDPDTLRGIRRVLRENGRLIVVPEARLSGSSWAVRSVEWLYQVTGQRHGVVESGAEESTPARWRLFEAHLKQAGFDSSFAQTTLSRSIVTVVIALKKPAAQS